MNKLVKVWNIGRVSYTKGLKLQKYVADLHVTQTDHVNNTILLLEHDPVYTVGIRRHDYSKEDEVKLRALGKYTNQLDSILCRFLLTYI